MIFDFFRKHARHIRLVTTLGVPSLIYSARHHHPFKKPVARLMSEAMVSGKHSFSEKSMRLIEHYARQFNEAACSVATTETVLNALFTSPLYKGEVKKISQQEILNQVKAVDWKERISPSGNQGKRGLPLQELEMALQASLEQYDIPFKNIETVFLNDPSESPDHLKEKLMEALNRFETDNHIFMVAHFNQGVFLRGIHLPHISPVGAFSTTRQKVLILDVDKDGPGPYWVSFDNFFKAMAHDFDGKLKDFGYAGGGYIVIRSGV